MTEWWNMYRWKSVNRAVTELVRVILEEVYAENKDKRLKEILTEEHAYNKISLYIFAASRVMASCKSTQKD